MSNKNTILHQHLFEMGEVVYGIVKRVIENSNVVIKLNPKDCYLYIPHYAIEYLNEYLSNFPMMETNFGKGVVWDIQGFRVVPGYENKIVLAHKDYVERNLEDYVSSETIQL